MNALVSIAPILDDLIDRAMGAHDAAVDFAHTRNLTDSAALRIAARALQGAIDDWCHDNHTTETAVPPALRDVALARVVAAGWDARQATEEQETA